MFLTALVKVNVITYDSLSTLNYMSAFEVFNHYLFRKPKLLTNLKLSWLFLR